MANRYFTQLKTSGATVRTLLFNFESPHQTALSVTFGFFLGIFPVVGVTTMMCLVAIFVFRLNYLATISTNLLASPIQLALLYPFWRAGHLLSFSSNAGNSELEIPTSFTSLSQNWSKFSEWLFDAVLVWAAFSLLGGFVLYFILRKLQNLRAEK